MPKTKSIPAVVSDVLTTFESATDPVSGWDRTIVGTYHTIVAMTNDLCGTKYTWDDVAGALTWLHKDGPDRVGATITKVGPGRSNMSATDHTEGEVVEFGGNVYLMIVDGVEIPDAGKRSIIIQGQIAWCDHRISALRNDILMQAMIRSQYPAAKGAGYTGIRRMLNKTIAQMAESLTATQDLRATLETVV
jgi:hypothetical protein